MLYKKYHRNFVSRFKKRVKFEVRSVETVEKEPYIWKRNICVFGSRYGCWTLVISDGSLSRDIHVV